MGSANSVCNFGVNDKNQFDADFSEEYNQYGQVKKQNVLNNFIQQVAHSKKDDRFYLKSTEHQQIQSAIIKRKNSLRNNQKEFNNGNVKVVLF